MGISPFDFDNLIIETRSVGEILYTLVLMVLYTYLYSNIVIIRMSSTLPRETIMVLIVDSVALALEYIVLMVIWVYAIVYQNEIQFIFKVFKGLIGTTVSMKMQQVHARIFQKMQIHLLVLNFVFMCVFVADTMLFFLEIPNFPVVKWVPFNLFRSLSLNFVAIYIYCLMVIKEIFHFINESISRSKKFSVETSRLSGYGGRHLMTFEPDNCLRYYGRLHSHLSDFISILTEYFALPILLVLVIQFCQSLVNLYLILTIMNTHLRNWSQQLTLFFTVIGWLIIRVVSLLFLLHACDSTCEEANRMVNVLHTMWASRALVGYKEMLTILSYRSMRKRLEIKLYGGIQLNNELEYKMAGMITTYLIVMLQLDEGTQDDI